VSPTAGKVIAEERIFENPTAGSFPGVLI